MPTPENDQSLPVSLNMIERDPRYLTIKPLVNDGAIQSLSDIIKFHKRTVIAKDIGKKVGRFNYLIEHPEKFTLEELLMIAKLCHLEYDEIMRLTKIELEKRKKSPRRFLKKPDKT